MRTAAIIVAAGLGQRATIAGEPAKQFTNLNGSNAAEMSLAAFENHPGIQTTIIILHPDELERADKRIRTQPPAGKARLAPVAGGETRQNSVRLGLETLARLTNDIDIVLIHDAARPFVDQETISRVIEATTSEAGALAAMPVNDTVKRGRAGLVSETVDRSELWCAQTPQAFPFHKLLDAHRNALGAGDVNFTDDAAIAEWAGMPVRLVAGSEDNIKLTTPADIQRARTRLSAPMNENLETIVSTGFDIHRTCPGDHVWLGGVKIPHSFGLDGHSDADVALHALTDAILGGIGDGDIGTHFPPTDDRWKGAQSILFLKHAMQRLTTARGKLRHVDISILAEAPKIGPHRQAIIACLAEATGLPPNRIGLKATTMEKLGALGRNEGIAAMATATLMLPPIDAKLPRGSR